MTISTFHVQDVLRIYSRQLSQGKALKRDIDQSRFGDDRISISAEAKRTAIIRKIASEVVDRIAINGPSNDVEADTLKELEDEYGSTLSVDKDVDSDALVFKVVNKQKETLEIVPAEEADFLRQRLEEIAKTKIGENMFE